MQRLRLKLETPKTRKGNGKMTTTNLDEHFQLIIDFPDDWHVHFRDGEDMLAVIGFTANRFRRATIMPNLKDNLITNWKKAESYLTRIKLALLETGADPRFKPMMTIYLTDKTTPEDIYEAKANGVVAAKMYPANATTNSAGGVTNVKKLRKVFWAMMRCGMILLVHGEKLTSRKYGYATCKWEVGQLRREYVFIRETASWLVKNFPDLKIVFEHITTKQAVEFVTKCSANVAATITAHHLVENLDAVFKSHHNKCMPILKEEPHRQALLDAATSGSPKFFGGTDTASHAKKDKETDCGCAGCFTAPHAVELYVTAFEERQALRKLEGFLSHFGADFYQVPRNTDKMTINRKPWIIPKEYPYGNGEKLVPFWAGRTLNWKVED